MTRSIPLSSISIALIVAACGHAPPPPARKSGPDRAVQVGQASFYANDAAGKKTATGEPLKLNGMTAASRTLPLGTHVQVVNKETGQSAHVRINDRGPYVDGRVIDLTPKAARAIGLDRDDGIAPVAVRPVATGKPPD